MYSFIETTEISKELKDGKYFTYGKVSEIRDEGFKLENSEILFLSVFKVNTNDFVRVFFTKDKDDFIVDIVQKIDFEDFKKVNDLFQKYKNLYI
ncbi:MAG: hypothetical protein QXS69_03050 [Candidatus Aenigmatarchaeota archaeon]